MHIKIQHKEPTSCLPQIMTPKHGRHLTNSSPVPAIANTPPSIPRMAVPQSCTGRDTSPVGPKVPSSSTEGSFSPTSGKSGHVRLYYIQVSSS